MTEGHESIPYVEEDAKSERETSERIHWHLCGVVDSNMKCADRLSSWAVTGIACVLMYG